MTTKFLEKTRRYDGFVFALIKRGAGYSVVKCTGYCWKYVDGGKAPMSFDSAKNLLAYCLL